MSSQIDSRAIKKALIKVNNYEKSNRSLKKRSEDFQVFQDVFNKPTLLTPKMIHFIGVLREDTMYIYDSSHVACF